MKVYVAAASNEIERAELWMARLRQVGITVVSTWAENIRKVGAANPMNVTREQRAVWAKGCLSEVSDANVLWFLLPPKGVYTDGAPTEFGYALLFGAIAQEARQAGVEGAPNFRIAVSGTERSIFTSLALHYASDDAAFEDIASGAVFMRGAPRAM